MRCFVMELPEVKPNWRAWQELQGHLELALEDLLVLSKLLQLTTPQYRLELSTNHAQTLHSLSSSLASLRATCAFFVPTVMSTGFLRLGYSGLERESLYTLATQQTTKWYSTCVPTSFWRDGRVQGVNPITE
jgi:hypothetical protein